MTDRTYVDIAALTQGGINLDEWSRMAADIAERMRTATTMYASAGGTGEMGQQFDQNYKPGEAKALQFLALLEKVVGSYADMTLSAARKFDDTNTEADNATPFE